MFIITSLHVGWNLRSDPSGCSRVHTPPNAVASNARSPVLEEKGFEISGKLQILYLGILAALYAHKNVLYIHIGSRRDIFSGDVF